MCLIPGDLHKRTPGVLETSASSRLPVSILMRLDLPTFDLPITAISGYFGGGQSRRLTLLLTYSAEVTLEFFGGGN